MIIGNSFSNLTYNIEQSVKDTQPPANPESTSSQTDTLSQGQDTRPKPKYSGTTSLGGGKLL